MKVVMFTYWENVWVRYLRKYFDAIPDIDFEILVNSQINNKAMEGADVVIFGWANEAVIQLSKYFMKFAKRYIVFVRSYEIFFGHIQKINWKHIDDCIFVNPAFAREYGNIPTNVHFMPNAIDLDEWKLQPHKKGNNIAWVANLNHKKGIDLIPQYMSRMVAINPEYVLHVAGKDQEPRHVKYMMNMLKELDLLDNVKFYGKVENIREWLKDKDYLFTSSVTEGHPNNVLEAMALGIKPLIHNWIGAKELFPKELIWSTLTEAISMTACDEYDSKKYRKFIKDNYSLNVYKKLEKIIRSNVG